MRLSCLFFGACLCLVPAFLTACGSSADNGANGSGGGAGAANGGAANGAGGAANGGAGGAANGGAGGAANGGAGGAGPTLGKPITAPDKTWTWVPFPGAHCSDGSPTGIGVNLNSASDKVVIYLEGGNACFNLVTCAATPTSYGASDFKGQAFAGLFDRSQAKNPLKDWNYVYVPYCTGDVHAGDNPNGSVKNVTGTEQFVGYADMAQFLARLVPTFANASQVLLTGASAGGFGAAANYLQTQEYFGSVPVDLLDDSGPPFPSSTIPTCFQDELRKLWGLDATILKACGSHCPNKSDYLADLTKYAAQKYPDRRLALISSVGDSTIRQFLQFAENNCTIGSVSAQQYETGLMGLRTAMKSDSNFGSYYIGQCSGANPCTHHTWITDNAHFYGTTVGGTALTDYVSALVSGKVSNVGP